MSDLAQKLIAENKATKAKFLDLGNCGLREIPAAVSDLVWLEGLSLASTWFEWEGERWNYTSSRNDGNKNSVADLTPLACLSSLRSLYLYEMPVDDLTPLARLSALRSLDLTDAPAKDMTSLASLSGLQFLNLLSTGIADLSPLAGLSRLQGLNLAGTLVNDLTALARLSGLRALGLFGTPVTDLAPLARLSDLQKGHSVTRRLAT